MRTLLLVLAALAAGFGAGYLSRGPGDAPERVARRPARGTTDPGIRPRESSTDLERALATLAALPSPEPRRGDGSIEGTVRTPDGRPLEGVRIRAVLWPDVDKLRRTPEDDTRPRLEDDVRRYVRWHRERWANTLDTVSDAAGAFAFTGLADADYWVSGHVAGYEVTADGSVMKEAGPGAKIEFVARTVRDVRIEVLLPDGTAAAAALIEADPEYGGEALMETWTRGQPSVRLPPGAYALDATHKGLTCEPVRVVVAADTPTPPVTLRLRPKAGLRGRVTFAKGKPLSTIMVNVLRLDAGEKPDPQRLPDDGESDWIFVGGETYEFDDEEVGPGRFLVGVVFHETVVAWRVVEIGKGSSQRCDFEKLELPAEGFVAVDVRGPGGEPVQDLEVFAGVDDDGDVSTDEDSAFQRRDGGLLVAHYPAGKEARLFVEVFSKRFGRKRAYYERGRARPVRIEFGAPARLAVALRGYVGSGHEGWLRAALARSDHSAEEIEELGDDAPALDGDGKIELGPAETGLCLLVVYVQVGDEYYEAARHEVQLRAGANQLAIAMPVLHRLVIRAPGLKPGTALQLAPDRSETWLAVERRIGEDGRVVFPRLPTGRYELSKEDVYDAAMLVDLPHAGELLFEPRKTVYNALSVHIGDAEGLLAKAGLVDGDLVVGIGGTEFTSQRQMGLLMVQAAARTGATTLLIERGGRRLEIELNLQALIAAGENAGGGLRPASR
jgi:hypothetical protein